MSAPAATPACVHLRISGRVQGVGYRYSALVEAQRLGLRGWVRNTADGAVELVAEGDETHLERLVTWCRIGPPGAVVQHVEQQGMRATGDFSDFRIRR